jgi:hypothetical protein
MPTGLKRSAPGYRRLSQAFPLGAGAIADNLQPDSMLQ